MKRHQMTTAEVLQMMVKGEHLPHRADREGRALPTPDAERLEVHGDLVEMAQDPEKIRTRCIGCDTDVAVYLTALCACGGMVCAACQGEEEEGVCTHELRTVGEAMDAAREADAKRGQTTTVAEQWEVFQQRVLPSLSPEAFPVIHSTFYAGAFSLMQLVRAAADLGTQEAFQARMDALRDELHAWYRNEAAGANERVM